MKKLLAMMAMLASLGLSGCASTANSLMAMAAVFQGAAVAVNASDFSLRAMSGMPPNGAYQQVYYGPYGQYQQPYQPQQSMYYYGQQPMQQYQPQYPQPQPWQQGPYGTFASFNGQPMQQAVYDPGEDARETANAARDTDGQGGDFFGGCCG